VAARGHLPVIEEELPREARAAFVDAAGDEDARPMQDPQQNGAGAPREPAAERGAIPLVLVTGMSGAGRSTSLKVLADLGYEAIDNLPLDLMNDLLDEGAITRPLAVGVDTRSRNFAVKPLLEQVDRLIAGSRAAVTLLFLNCEDDVLQRRFTETRRTHPLAQGRPLADGLRAERQLVEPLRSRADLVIDTTDLGPHDLRRLLTGHLAVEERSKLAVFVTSFSYRQGVPREADLVFDVRFLANPHYDEVLRPLPGNDRRVAEYVERDPDFPLFFERLTEMLGPLLPRYEAEGKSYLTIAIGCTGGRHRSVAIAEKLAGWIGDEGRQVTLAHRDLKEAEPPQPDNPRDAEAGHIS
ncbi:MAG: RNase adapter RapZ, partial [Rhodovibrionaceae bacterium]|nr:RNase adapter RapZ [Rhodovibrionaceae bacterium]